jgi:hypothetical protein
VRPDTARYGAFEYVAECRGRWSWFRVFTTGDARYYLFDQLVGDTGVSSGLQFPVAKSELRRDVRSALANGWSHRRRGRPGGLGTRANRLVPPPARDEETWGLI